MRNFINLPDDCDTLLHLYIFNIIDRVLHCIKPDITDPNNYIKLYDYTKIFIEFYIANTSHCQGLHPRSLLPSPR